MYPCPRKICAQVSRVLMRNFAGAVVAGGVLKRDIILAAKITAGCLRGQKAVSCLISSLVTKTGRVAAGCERVNSMATKLSED